MAVWMYKKIKEGGVKKALIDPKFRKNHVDSGWVFKRSELEEPKPIEKPIIEEKPDVSRETVLDKPDSDVPEKPKPKKVKKSRKKATKKVE